MSNQAGQSVAHFLFYFDVGLEMARIVQEHAFCQNDVKINRQFYVPVNSSLNEQIGERKYEYVIAKGTAVAKYSQDIVSLCLHCSVLFWGGESQPV